MHKNLDRREIPIFGILPYMFDMEKILAAYSPYTNKDMYNDLDGQNPSAEFRELCAEKKSLHKLFVSEDERDVPAGTPYRSDSYKQLSLTEFDGDRQTEFSNGMVESVKSSMDRNFKNYKPIMDERNYTKRNDKCVGYWNEILDTFKSQPTRTRLANCAPHFGIDPHIDYNTSYSIRVHIPIITNQDSFLCVKVDGKTHKMHCPADGRVYFMNTGLVHWAENNGDTERVHLVISLNGQEDIKDMVVVNDSNLRT